MTSREKLKNRTNLVHSYRQNLVADSLIGTSMSPSVISGRFGGKWRT
jgi:hypothetical protein